MARENNGVTTGDKEYFDVNKHSNALYGGDDASSESRVSESRVSQSLIRDDDSGVTRVWNTHE